MNAAIIATVLTGVASLTTLVGVLWSWVRGTRKSSARLTMRLPSGTELSIRTDKATPGEIEDFLATIVEKGGRPEKTSPQTESEPPENAQMNTQIEQRILKIHLDDPKLGPSEIRKKLYAEGFEVSLEDVTDVLTKHGKS